MKLAGDYCEPEKTNINVEFSIESIVGHLILTKKEEKKVFVIRANALLLRFGIFPV